MTGWTAAESIKVTTGWLAMSEYFINGRRVTNYKPDPSQSCLAVSRGKTEAEAMERLADNKRMALSFHGVNEYA